MELNLDFSAVDEEFGAGHVAALVGGEKHHGGGDLVGAAESAHWDGRRDVVEQRLLFASRC